MKKEGTGSHWSTAASVLLALCLLATFSFNTSAQEFVDEDGDGMDDDWEADYGLNSTDPSDAEDDPDLDELTNLQEYLNSTDPNSNDTDSDQIHDGWEVRYGLDPRNPYDADDDDDNDGYSNLAEFFLDSDPRDRNDPYSGDDDDDDDSIVDDDDEDASLGNEQTTICGLLLFIIAAMIVLGIVIGIYSKIRHDRLLEHQTRQTIVDYLKEHPGAYYSQIRKELDLVHGVLTHHINILEQQELLFSKQDRSYRRFFLDGMYKKGPIVVGKQKEVLDAIRRKPGSSQSDIGRVLGMGRMIVSYHINQLEELGLVEKVKSGRENLVYPKNGDDKKTEEVRTGVET